MKYKLNQIERTLILFLEVILLIFINFLIFKRFFPILSNTGLWFYVALLNIILGSSLISPFFIKPVDVITYTLTAIISMLFVLNWNNWNKLSKFFFVISFFSASLLLILAFLSIIFKDSEKELLSKIINVINYILKIFGIPQIIFSLVYIFAIFTFHYPNVKQVAFLFLTLFLIIIIHPFHLIIDILKKVKIVFSSNLIISNIGRVVAYQHPGIVLIKQIPNTYCRFLTPLYINDSISSPKIALSLDYVGRSDGLFLRSVIIQSKNNEYLEKLSKQVPLDSAIKLNQEKFKDLDDILVNNIKLLNNIIGLVSTETTIEKLQFELIKEENLYEGRLIEANINEKIVVYQILGGLTKEEIVERKNTFGYVKVQAKKIGIWNKKIKKFENIRWMPKINSPVFLMEEKEFRVKSDYIGHFPGTNYPLFIKDINSLVTHNTAILGILGVGKTMLSIELVERIIHAGIKVICLDLTNQYLKELFDFIDFEFEEKSIKKIQDAGEKDRNEYAENPQEGGSLINFRKAIYDDINYFINFNNTSFLKIYNPSQLFATKQLNEPKSFRINDKWYRSAGLYDITPVEVTQIISEITLDILSSEMVEQAKVCLVYEEAHSLVPEWNSTVVEGDKHATSGTARAVLQGRKHGLGCLLITQRTANVTKTILNQCNSIFAMRSFDNTGIEFLSNYIGSDYASILSSLPERHAVYFGKSSSCENPVLIRLNDREKFIKSFRRKNKPKKPEKK